MKSRLRLLSLSLRATFALLLFGSVNAYAATFYVAPTGKDTNLGTATAPWLTIQRAANIVNPGDIVVVQPGTYRGAKFSRSGLATAYIRFVGQPGAIVNSPGALNTNGDNLWIRNAHYIRLGRTYGYDLHSILNPGLATLFVNPTVANYHLKTGSPAINTGVVVTGVIDDIDGNPRPQGLRYDIGADEVLVP